MDETERKIYAVICRNDGIKAKDIARESGVKRSEINRLLYENGDTLYLIEGAETDLAAMAAAVGFLVEGVANMLGTVGLVIAVFGIMGVLTEAGMLDFLVEKILGSKMAQTPKGAEMACLIGISATTFIFGGVTSASILTFGPVLNKIGHAKKLHPYRRANLLDGVANSLPAIIPFMSVFVFIGAALSGLSPVSVALGTFYGVVLFVVFLVAVITGWGRRFEGKNGEELKEEPKE